jgi:hypothetical protein
MGARDAEVHPMLKFIQAYITVMGWAGFVLFSVAGVAVFITSQMEGALLLRSALVSLGLVLLGVIALVIARFYRALANRALGDRNREPGGGQ